ncbi:hypothetical protein BKA70DRAFT_1260717 [Coprinopsis sp. MPI-PUGE-AT-0042]|nr:hypothetical protein BKA70DRAFT_1260717 [Coprinopsis sp. MPI-PUGE-AT-0042]
MPSHIQSVPSSSKATTVPDPAPTTGRAMPRVPVPVVKKLVNAISRAPVEHTFPPFYCCYLLKSAKTPDAKAVYIGSTNNPYRRIRQHNDEVKGGARKTSQGRPWIMQMLLHGFPSRQAALQFEWAWQHPWKSRFMKDGTTFERLFGKGSKGVAGNIKIVRTMIRTHPFTLWPLHVKLFTEDGVRSWDKLDKLEGIQSIFLGSPSEASFQALENYGLIAPRGKGKGKAVALPDNSEEDGFPRGFTCSVELEGVDGKSGHILASGRVGPVDETDVAFTSRILAKNTSLIASGQVPNCAVCHEPILDYAKNPLETSLCTHGTCDSVSHLKCLSQSFLPPPSPMPSPRSRSRSKSPSARSKSKAVLAPPASHFVPRGGPCPSCNTYTLWGEIIKGCYRRQGGSTLPILPDDEDLDTGAIEDVEEDVDVDGLTGAMGGLDLDGGYEAATPTTKPKGKPPRVPGPSKAKATSAPKRGRPPKSGRAGAHSDLSESGEEFDFSGIRSSDSENSDAVSGSSTRRSKKARKAVASTSKARAKPASEAVKATKRAAASNTKSKSKSRSPSRSRSTSPAAHLSAQRLREALELDLGSNVDVMVVKRGPGRPRKQATSSASPSKAAATPPVSRGPGRPRKSTSPSKAPAAKRSRTTLKSKAVKGRPTARTIGPMSDSESDCGPSFGYGAGMLDSLRGGSGSKTQGKTKPKSRGPARGRPRSKTPPENGKRGYATQSHETIPLSIAAGTVTRPRLAPANAFTARLSDISISSDSDSSTVAATIDTIDSDSDTDYISFSSDGSPTKRTRGNGGHLKTWEPPVSALGSSYRLTPQLDAKIAGLSLEDREVIELSD